MDALSSQVADVQTWTVLEFPILLEKVSSLAGSNAGRHMVMELKPNPDLAVVGRRLQRLSLVRVLLEHLPAPDLAAIDEVKPLFSRLSVQGAFLLPAELLLVADFLNSLDGVLNFLEGADSRQLQLEHAGEAYNEVARLANQMAPLPQMVKDLRRIVGVGNSVSSQASVELGRIRREMNRRRDSLRLTLGGLLQREDLASVFSDQLITQRAERFVLPVKTDAKGKLAGIIHDTSGTGATCFVEPMEAVEGNNQLALLLRQEKEEEERILKEISGRLAVELAVLQRNRQCLVKLDCLLAQARFCQKLECVTPSLSKSGEIALHKARHPLLAWRALSRPDKPVVPIMLNVGYDKRALVISGANAGGKTAALKTLGLLTFMAMCGMQVPCAQHSKLAVFQKVIAEIGDEQSLDLALSTFTAHATRLAYMVKNANEHTMLLIDEIGGGTDPNEGAALALAVLKWLQKSRSCILCTTHYHRLKAYAAMTPGVENVSVAFAPGSGNATYQLHYGLAGFSGALQVSKNMGFPPALLEMAGQEMDEGESQTIALLHQAHEAREKAEDEFRQASSQLLQARQTKEEANALLKTARLRQAGALAEGKRKVREMIRRFEQRLEKILHKVEEAEAKGERVSLGRAKQELYEARRQYQEEMENALLPQEEKPKITTTRSFELQAGQRVRLLNLEQDGVLMETPKPDQALAPVAVGVKGVRIMARVNQLAPLTMAPGFTAAVDNQVRVQATASDGLALNLVGMHVDDAIDKLDKALDQAVMGGRNQVEIIHGLGTGRLKNAIREYLNLHPFVAGYHAPANRSGSITIAQLKD